MQIKQRLRINSILNVMAVFAIICAVVAALYKIDKAVKASDLAGQIVAGAFERVAFRNDYVQTGSERAKVQWFAKHAQMGEVIEAAGLRFRDAEDVGTLKELHADHVAMEKIFSEIVTNRENPASSNLPALSQETEKRLINQLNMRVYETALNGRRLREAARSDLFHTLKMTGVGIVGLLLLVGTLTIANSWKMSGMITERVLKLREGASLIGSGNLEHRIDLQGDDEFAALSESFNKMTTQLSDSYKNLENEVEEHERARESLRTSEQFTREILDNLFTFVAVLRIDGILISVNSAPLKAAGISEADVLGKPFWECYWWTYDPKVQADVRGACERAARGEASRYDVPVRTANGTLTWIDFQIAPLRDAAESITHIIPSAMVITERKQAEHKLRESEERLSSLYKSMTEGMATHDMVYADETAVDYIISDVNPAFEKITGITRESAVGKKATVVYGTERAPYLDVYAKVAGGGESFTFETYFEPMGKHFAISVFSPGKGKFATVFSDISERKKTEERLKASLEEKEVLLKEIHHRVKNNMQVISSLVALQSRELKDSGVRDILDEVAHRVRSMALVHEMLYQSADLSQVDFAEYVKSLLGYLWRAYGSGASDVRLTLDLEQVFLTVYIAVPCGLILNELVSNALKHAFRDRGNGEVVVSLHKSEGRVLLSVRDDGAGLPDGFDWRSARSLGLRLVQMLAGQLKAEVRADRGNGTEFRVTFNTNAVGGGSIGKGGQGCSGNL